MEIFTNPQKGYPSSFIHHLVRWLFTLPAKTYPQFFPLQFLYNYAKTKQQVGRNFDLPAGVIANSFVVFDEAHLYSRFTDKDRKQKNRRMQSFEKNQDEQKSGIIVSTQVCEVGLDVRYGVLEFKSYYSQARTQKTNSLQQATDNIFSNICVLFSGTDY